MVGECGWRWCSGGIGGTASSRASAQLGLAPARCCVDLPSACHRRALGQAHEHVAQVLVRGAVAGLVAQAPFSSRPARAPCRSRPGRPAARPGCCRARAVRGSPRHALRRRRSMASVCAGLRRHHAAAGSAAAHRPGAWRPGPDRQRCSAYSGRPAAGSSLHVTQFVGARHVQRQQAGSSRQISSRPWRPVGPGFIVKDRRIGGMAMDQGRCGSSSRAAGRRYTDFIVVRRRFDRTLLQPPAGPAAGHAAPAIAGILPRRLAPAAPRRPAERPMTLRIHNTLTRSGSSPFTPIDAGPGAHVRVRHDDLRPVPCRPCAHDDGLRRGLPLAAGERLPSPTCATSPTSTTRSSAALRRTPSRSMRSRRRDDRGDAPPTSALWASCRPRTSRAPPTTCRRCSS